MLAYAKSVYGVLSCRSVSAPLFVTEPSFCAVAARLVDVAECAASVLSVEFRQKTRRAANGGCGDPTAFSFHSLSIFFFVFLHLTEIGVMKCVLIYPTGLGKKKKRFTDLVC